MENSLDENVYDFVRNLFVSGRVNTDQLKQTIVDTANFMSLQFPGEKAQIEDIYRNLMTDYVVYADEPKVLEDNRDHQEWLSNAKSDIEWNFWKRYKKYLTKDIRLPHAVIDNLDNTTDEILRRLESPKRKGQWDRRGMVVGNVQSGKTSNYIGLINKAVDAGYKVIIVLAGLNNDLRSQTQKRTDAGFLGVDTRKRDGYDQTSYRIGAGKRTEFHLLTPNAVTSAEANGDFKKRVHHAVTITPGGTPIIAVVKKNVSPLKNLLNWFTSINENGKVVDVPLLLIDDEADNASIDTKADVQIGGYNNLYDYEGLEDDNKESDPTKINGYIRQILNCFTQSAYVGYTATPFANIFIYPKDEKNIGEKYGDDLYPRSFIINLKAPSNYIGPEKVFGLQSDRVAGIEEVTPLPLTRIANDYSAVFPVRHKKTLQVKKLPATMFKAIYSFILAIAVRKIRGEEKKHNSMLVHVTRFVDVQKQIAELLAKEMRNIILQLEFATGSQYENLINELHELWENDFVPTTKSVRNYLKDDTITDISWEEIEIVLYECASRIEVKTVNGKAADGGLNYDEYPDGCCVIAVGGDKLSRGFTLEGLTISYYARMSRMYDTLLQMGRWFGYRDGYADVCRLYTSGTLLEWYQHIALANEELCQELDDMADMNATPENYGLKVRTHPDGMLITSMNKMRNSEKRVVTYAGSLLQIARYYKNNKCNQANIDFADKWLKQLGTPDKMPSIITHNNYLWENKRPEEIIDFLSHITIHPTCFAASPKIVIEYIKNQVAEGELTEWTVALVSIKAGDVYNIGGLPIGVSWRSDDNPDDKEILHLCRRNLITENDQDVDLTEEEKKRAKDLTIVAWENSQSNKKKPESASPVQIRKVRNKKKCLLMIYVFASGVIKDGHRTYYKDKYLGYAISFPSSSTAKTVQYRVDEIYVRNTFDEE